MLHRHPPDAQVARRYLLLCSVRFLATGGLAAVPVVLAASDLGRATLPLFVACAVVAVSSLLLVVASASALIDRHWAVPALPVLAFAVWTAGVLATLATATLGGDDAWLMFALGAVILLAARPPLMLKNYLSFLNRSP